MLDGADVQLSSKASVWKRRARDLKRMSLPVRTMWTTVYTACLRGLILWKAEIVDNAKCALGIQTNMLRCVCEVCTWHTNEYVAMSV